MVLSIGMIVKNEEQGLRECLKGIKPILEQVDSELIIADTGSADATAAIAKEFTDNVYQIEWRGDFAWARNTTLERAKGEWYMYLDADEVFQDVSEIIEFFNSGEYKGYMSANHLRYETGPEQYNTIFRLHKKDKDAVFIGKIHEQIPFKPPVKKLGSVSMHTGYSYGGEEGREKQAEKYRRNLRPLLEMHGEKPGDLRILGHIVIESMINGDYGTAGKYLGIGLNLQGKDSKNVYYHSLRRLKVLHYANTGQAQKAVDEIRDYFSTSLKLFSFAIELRLIEAVIQERQGNNGKAVTAYEEAIKLFDAYSEGRLDKADEELTITKNVPPDTKVASVKGIIRQYAALGDFSGVFDWIGKSYNDAFFQEDGFINCAHKAYECKSKGDKLGFVSNLREAVKADPSMRDAVLAVINGLEETRDAGALDSLNKETAALKGAIYEMIKNKQFEMAARILEQYAKINPADPDINTIRMDINKLS